MSIRDEQDKVAWVHQARWAANKVFRMKWDQMKENSDFLRLKQYSEDQLKKFSDQKRVPYVLDYINSAINTYQGIQRDRRTEIFYYASEPGDEVKTEVLNAVKDSVLDRNSFVYIESDVFKDGITEKIGAIGYEWSREKDKNGALKMFRIPPRQVMWDLNSREYDKDDASWISRHRLYTQRSLLAKYPDKRKKIDKLFSMDGDWWTALGLDQAYVSEIMDGDLKALAVVEFYEKMWEKRWFVRENTQGYIEPLYYESEKDAQTAIEEKMQKYQQVVQQLSSQPVGSDGPQSPPPPPELESFSDNFPVIEKTEVCGNVWLSTETLKEPFYPIDIYHSLEHDGDWYCPLDLLKDGQRYFNKMFSQLDHQISSASKGLVLVGKGRSTKAEKAMVKDAWSTTGGFVEVSDPSNYVMIDQKGPAPQLFSMIETARANLEDNAGGRNFMGKKETASESGVAVRTRIEQGSLSGFIVYDNLRRWKMSVGKKMAWYLTHYMTVPQVVRIIGEELVQETMQKLSMDETSSSWFKQSSVRPGVGYLTINSEPINTLENLEVDCVVDEARWSISKNQSTLQEINLAMQSNPNLASTFPPEVILEFMNLPFSVKEQARQRMKQLEQNQMQAQQAEMNPKPKFTAALGDIDKLPPEGAAQLALEFGIKMDPNSIEDPNQKEFALKAAQMMADHRLKTQKHEMDMSLAQQKANQDLVINAEKAAMGNKLAHVKGLHGMHLASQRSELEDRTAPKEND